MALDELAAALQRAKTVLERRPELGAHDDAPATARWENGTRIVASHASGKQVVTDMPTELGGSGDQVSPGWMFRAGFASCAATSIAMSAAREGIQLTALEVKASSRSDTRGLLGMAEASGESVYAGPSSVELNVRVSARDASDARLRELVEKSIRCSPIPNAVKNPVRVALNIDTEAA